MTERRAERTARLQIVSAGAKLASLGLIATGEGNLSVRVGSNSMLISPSGADKGRLEAADLLLVSIDEVRFPGAASCETPMHRLIYRSHPKVEAVVHAHSISAIALAANEIAFESDKLVEAQASVGVVGIVERHPCGSMELANEVAEELENVSSCVMRDHGVVTTGSTLQEAVRQMVALDRLARLQLEDRAG